MSYSIVMALQISINIFWIFQMVTACSVVTCNLLYLNVVLKTKIVGINSKNTVETTNLYRLVIWI